MYYPINMNMPINYDTITESIDSIVDSYFTEAVFSGGKEKVKPLEEYIQKFKNELDERIKEQDENKKQFDPKAYWRNTLFKDFEDELRKIFGFRNVELHPFIEKYNSKDKMFDTRQLNCVIYHVDRFPVEGLIGDDGFYDKSKSLTMEIYMSLGVIKHLNADEILAVLLHEFGHSIDPALTDIKYTETNILSKYITDRRSSINKDEKRLMKNLVISLDLLQ